MTIPTTQPRPHTSLTFELAHPDDAPQFGPRLGKVTLARPDGDGDVVLETPGMMAATSRGVVPHLSWDHYRATDAVRWVNVHFESFLDHTKPLPTLLDALRPLHTILGFAPSRNIVALSLRDPAEDREMPPNMNDTVMAHCVRGVRKVTTANWRAYVRACNPDVVTALSDTPFTPPPHSQKRLTKSIERSLAWLADLLRPAERPTSVLVHMAGGASLAARAAFADGLAEKLYGKDAEAVAPFQALDDGVAGYVFDLAPLHQALRASTDAAADGASTPTNAQKAKTPSPGARAHLLAPAPPPAPAAELVPLLHASLEQLPRHKLRLAHSAHSPHEALRLLAAVGLDLFDARWAQRAADVGVALDFAFPAPVGATDSADVGHNLYDERYARQFVRLADLFVDGASAAAAGSDAAVCPCIACSPRATEHVLSHSTADPAPPPSAATPAPAYTRAYVHHLLHTHEMSAHALLAAHNLAVLAAFFAGVRRVLREAPGTFEAEVARFEAAYDGGLGVVEKARVDWLAVDMARGKGRLAREKEKQAEATLGTAVEL